MTGVGLLFVVLAAIVGVVAALPGEELGMAPGTDRKFVKLLLCGGAVAVLLVLAAVLRVFGVRFFRE